MSTNVRFTHLKIPILADSRENNTTQMVLDGELAVKLHAKGVEVGTSENGNPRQDKVIMGRVHSPGSTND